MHSPKTFLKILDGYSMNLKNNRIHKTIQTQYETQFSAYRQDYIFNTDSYLLWQVIHEANIIHSDTPNPLKVKVDIQVNIQSIEDLLSIIESNVYDSSKEYNIDLKALHNIKPELKQLNSMIGLESVKTSILRQLMYFLQGFADDPKDGDYKHTVLTGPPGTGKTEIARILGNMYSKIGMLKSNVFKKVTRTDLVAGYLGQTAIKTRKVLDDCMGGVLFIDEAYSLQYDDSYAKECVDTLCEALSDNKNDLMVIIAGYQSELDNTFFRINSGIRSRFIWRFDIEPYGTKELFLIFKHLATSRNWSVDENLKQKWFETNKQFFKDNGRSMEQLFSYSKISHAQRIYGKDISLRKMLTCEDLQEGLSLYKEYGNTMKNDNISMSLYI
jgi:Holliday junction resolvasome RuvABC ATP-dependent DNA helicase subunit